MTEYTTQAGDRYAQCATVRDLALLAIHFEEFDAVRREAVMYAIYVLHRLGHEALVPTDAPPAQYQPAVLRDTPDMSRTFLRGRVA